MSITTPTNIKAVIFDLDGTLIDTEKWYMKAWPQAMEKYGYSMTYEQALSMRSLGRPYAPEHLKEISGDPDFSYPLIREYRKELMEKYLDENGIELKPFAMEILQKLREKGIVTALGTANDYERTERYLKRIGLFEYFDNIICASMVKRGKPSPDLYQYAVNEIGFAAHECLAVEDSPNGVMSASDAGIPTIMIPDLTEPDEELMQHIYRRYSSLHEFYADIFA